MLLPQFINVDVSKNLIFLNYSFSSMQEDPCCAGSYDMENKTKLQQAIQMAETVARQMSSAALMESDLHHRALCALCCLD